MESTSLSQKETGPTQRYKIVRFYRKSGRRKIMRRGLTYADARQWCNREDTQDPNGKWFDGFNPM